jgi:hypothetical protein
LVVQALVFVTLALELMSVLRTCSPLASDLLSAILFFIILPMQQIMQQQQQHERPIITQAMTRMT